MGRIALILLSVSFLAACAHEGLVPDGKSVTARREAPGSNCNFIGYIDGRAKTNKGDTKAAIEDLKIETARFGGNYVKIETVSGYGNSVRGAVYHCP